MKRQDGRFYSSNMDFKLLQIYTPDNSVTQQNADKFKQFSNNFKELFFKRGFLCRSRRGSLNPRTQVSNEFGGERKMTIHVHPLSDKTVEQRLAATSCHSSETQRATPLLSLNGMTIHACQSTSKSLFHSSSVPDTSLLHSSPLPQQRRVPRPLVFHLRHH